MVATDYKLVLAFSRTIIGSPSPTYTVAKHGARRLFNRLLVLSARSLLLVARSVTVLLGLRLHVFLRVPTWRRQYMPTLNTSVLLFCHAS